MQQERKQALEKMGISVQSVGISVQKNKFYLVNLNADPSLNEMLVYYLKVSNYLSVAKTVVIKDCFRLVTLDTGRLGADVLYNRAY